MSEQKKCVYCCDDDDRDHFVARKNFRQEIVMNYCPVCGRRL